MKSPLAWLRPEQRITDDLGVEHAIPVAEWTKGEHPSPRIAFVLKEAAGIAAGRGMDQSKVHLWTALGIVLSWTIVVFTIDMLPGLPSWLTRNVFLYAIFLGAIVTSIARRRYFKAHRARMITMMTRNGLCAACGYEAIEAPVGADGLRRCTECGAAWKADRFPSASVAGPGISTERDPVIRSLASLYRGPRKTRAILDHRGTSAALLSRTPKEAARADESPEVAARRDAAQREVRASRASERWILSLLAAGFGISMVAIMCGPAVRSVAFSWQSFWPLLIACLFLGSTSMWIWGIWTDRALTPPEHLDETLLRFRLCPGCCEDLQPVTPEQDGCRVCPVCAAAWRIPTQTDPYTPGSGRTLRSALLLVSSDDSGRPAMLDHAAWARSPGSTIPSLRTLIRRSALPVPSTLRAFVRALGYGIAGTLLSVVLLTSLQVSSDVIWILAPGMGLVLGVVYLAVWGSLRKPNESRLFIARAKRQGLCPACGYSLVGLAVPEDGFVPCPECGAKWRFDPVTGTTRATASAPRG